MGLSPDKPSRPPVAIVREAETPLGLVELRRRWSLALEQDVYEILVNGDLMMSSAVHVSEDALATRGLAETLPKELTVLIGGLGLGFTALAVAADPRVRALTVVEVLAPVIDWHVEGVLPSSSELLADERVEIVRDDFFSYLARSPTAATLFDLILVDIDDAPEVVWHRQHADFYTPPGVESAMSHVRPGGVLAFWFASQPQEDFLGFLGGVLQDVRIEPIEFEDPCLHRTQEHFLVIARRGA